MTLRTYNTMPYNSGAYLFGTAQLPAGIGPKPDPRRSTPTRSGPDPRRAAPTRSGPDPIRSTPT